MTECQRAEQLFPAATGPRLTTACREVLIEQHLPLFVAEFEKMLRNGDHSGKIASTPVYY